ncbi:hypothetical protein EG68_01194 [Paragonimus skrjabini miyazakii]|uniref:EF-hand domain-containing protein n=1 Tax=Paragonimus skrjabini miyazakii TaxID=59628 RepID=A0A8S9Z788_9TREM|nr:hypothetical protein EG68_01194 [Paragonimus skrjabini miyazakii]
MEVHDTAEICLRTFDDLDVDNVGRVHKIELCSRLADLMPEDCNIRDKLDSIPGQFITREEFQTVIDQITLEPRSTAQVSQQDWIDLFHAIDVDQSGYLSVDEVHAIFADDPLPMPIELIKSWIAQFDTNSDGQLSLAEFLEFVRKTTNKSYL